MTPLRFVTLLTCLTSLLLLVQGQEEAPDGTCLQGCDGSCCTYRVMDNPLQNLIDFNTSVSPGIYYGISVKLCADEPFAMGLWAPDVSRDDILVLQATWSYPGVNNAWKRITRDGERVYAMNFTSPLNVTRRLYFGLMGIAPVIPIPYSTDSPQPRALASISRYHSIQLGTLINGGRPGDRILFSTTVRIMRYTWTRSFSPNVEFCGSQQGCLDEAQCVGCRGPRGRPGPPGPPGPAGAAVPPFFGCDSPDALGTGINGLSDKSDEILNQLKKVENDVNKIPKGDRDTGICPRNYVSGSYGLGYCYNAWIQMSKSFGEAALACAAVDGSHLVDIERAEEDTFLAEYIVPLMTESQTNLTFFTSGLFSGRFRDWVWYSDQVLIRKTIGYTNWGPGQQDGHEKKRTCLVYVVFKDMTTQWISSSCTDKRGYICKTMKKCY